MEAGKRRLAGDTIRAATTDEVKDLRREARDLKEVVAERTSGALHGARKLFCIRDFRIPRPQGTRPDHQPSLYRDQGDE